MEKWPTEYKLQYGWKNSAATTPVPLLQAQEALDQRHHPDCPNKPADQHWRVESVDGDSCDAVEPDQDSAIEQAATVTTTDKPATAPVKKQKALEHLKQKARTRLAHKKPHRLPRNATATGQDKHTVPTKAKNRPQVAPSKTMIKKIEQDNETSGSDTDSQTGQKIQPLQQPTKKCSHKREKKRNVKRKLMWPMITEYQSQFKTKETSTVTDGDDDKVCNSVWSYVCILYYCLFLHVYVCMCALEFYITEITGSL